MSKLSKDYVSASEDENDEETMEFAPPVGYVRCKHLKKFQKKKSDEQLWLIKVPSSLDVSSLKSLPIDFSGKENGEAVIRSEGKTYSVNEDVTQREDQDNSNLTLLVPDESRDKLRVGADKHGSWKFDRVICVSETAKVPGIDYEELRVPRADVVKVEGLKVRHFASGYDEKKKSKKREAADAETGSPSKKHKKKDKKKSKIK